MPVLRLLYLCLVLLGSGIYITSTARAGEIDMIVPFGPGGPTDQIGRALIQALPANQYQMVYKPGASGRVGVRAMLQSHAMMLAVMPTIFVTNKLLYGDLEYDPDRDLETLAVIAVMPNLLVCHHSTGFRTVKDLIGATRSLNFAASGVGANDHLATALLLQQWPNRHAVIQYGQGGANRLTDLLSGVTDCMFSNYSLVKEHVTDARLNVILSSEDLGVNVATWQQEFGSPYPIRSMYAVIVSRHLDQVIEQRLRADLASAMMSASLAQKITDMGFVPVLKTDEKSIKQALSTNQLLADFISRSQLRLK